MKFVRCLLSTLLNLYYLIELIKSLASKTGHFFLIEETKPYSIEVLYALT